MEINSIIHLTEEFFYDAHKSGIMDYFPELSINHTYKILSTSEVIHDNGAITKGATKIQCIETLEVFDINELNLLPDESRSNMHWWCFVCDLFDDEYIISEEI